MISTKFRLALLLFTISLTTAIVAAQKDRCESLKDQREASGGRYFEELCDLEGTLDDELGGFTRDSCRFVCATRRGRTESHFAVANGQSCCMPGHQTWIDGTCYYGRCYERPEKPEHSQFEKRDDYRAYNIKFCKITGVNKDAFYPKRLSVRVTLDREFNPSEQHSYYRDDILCRSPLMRVNYEREDETWSVPLNYNCQTLPIKTGSNLRIELFDPDSGWSGNLISQVDNDKPSKETCAPIETSDCAACIEQLHIEKSPRSVSGLRPRWDNE